MDTRIKGLWLDALRSGEYKQAHETLAKVDPETKQVEGFCCLGVLCDLAVKEGVIPEPVLVDRYECKLAEELPKDRYQYGIPDESDYLSVSVGELPRAVMDWAGLSVSSPLVEDLNPDYDPDDDDELAELETFSVALSELNDNYNKTFTEIADLIERGL